MQMLKRLNLSISCLVLGAGCASMTAHAADNTVTQLIVKLKPVEGSANARPQAMSRDLMFNLSAKTAANLTYKRPMAGDAHLVKLPKAMSLAEAQTFAQAVSQQAEVAYAEPDRMVHAAMTTPNDTYFAEYQWNMQSSTAYAGAINAVNAWDLTTGSTNTTIAVVDTGITSDHAEFSGRFHSYVQKNGYTDIGIDMISDSTSAADGDDRDWDPYDSAGDWHGTHVAGILGATGNNGIGVAGVDWQARILPVRVLGASGGSLSDVIEGVRWAVGDPAVPIYAGDNSYGYIPQNPYPAKVVNLSLAGEGGCSAVEQETIDFAIAKGASVVVAAGNDGQNLDLIPYSPATCQGVINVAAVDPAGLKASFSNYGSSITIAAPGTTVDDTKGIASTVGPGTSYANAEYSGTSMAAPHVSGVIGLMLAANPSLTPAQVKQFLMASARPSVDNAWAGSMGAGLLDACRAVKLAQGQSMSSCNGSSDNSGGGGGGGSFDWLMAALLSMGITWRKITTLVQRKGGES